jgi:hypothetical protein
VSTVTDMQTWWNASPYFDVGFYLNGAENHPHNDTNLTAGWVQGVSAEGWGLMPIWVGFQAPCACHPTKSNPSTTYGGASPCNTFSQPMSWDPSQAENQGALDALGALTALGPATPPELNLPSTLVYFDMEQYASSAMCDSIHYSASCANATTCGAAVVSFLSGWDSVLQGNQYNFKAGVYGAPGDASSDFTQANPAS